MGDGIHIKRVAKSGCFHKPEYAAIIVSLDGQCFPAELDFSTRDTLDWWIAWKGKKPVAYAATQIYRINHEDVAFLSRAGVLPGFRGHGIQKRLIRVREKAAAHAGCGRVVTYTAPQNHASSNSLIACGYKLYTPKNTYGIKNALYFRKFI